MDITTERDAFLVELRLKTGPCHKALEQNPYSVALMAHDTTINDYRIYLEKLYGFVKPYEETVFKILDTYVPDIQKRRKTALVEQDLHALGVTPENLNALPFIHYSMPNSIADAFGAMYVLEGSTLGGSIIYKRLNYLLGVDKELNGKYFTAYGDDSGRYWKSFIAAFSQYAVESNMQETIINSAIDTFTNMDKWLLAEG